MKKNLMIARQSIPAIALCLICFVAKAQDSRILKNKYFGISIHNIGVVNGKTITIYRHEGRAWIYDAGNTFTIPADAREWFIWGEQIGVWRKSGRIDFYDNLGRGKWRLSDKGFPVGSDYDQVICCGQILGMRKGNRIDMYINKVIDPSLQFNLPLYWKEVFGSSMEILVTTDYSLQAFKVSPEMHWVKAENGYFEFPLNMKGIVPTPNEIGFGIATSTGVDLYQYTFGLSDRAYLSWSFTNPKK